jgi:hypothetical protein
LDEAGAPEGPGNGGTAGTPSTVDNQDETGGEAGTSGAGSGGGGAANTAGSASGGDAGVERDQRCESGSYDTNLDDDALTCAEWSVCPPGTFVDTAGTFKRDQLCTPCPEGTFLAESNGLACERWEKCFVGQQIEEDPSATTNRSCGTPEKFAYYYGHAKGFVVTEDRATLLMSASVDPSYPELDYTELLSYSLDGSQQASAILTGSADGGVYPDDDGWLSSLTQVNNELFVGGARGDAYTVSKLGPDGNRVWELELDATPESANVGLSGDASNVHAVLDVGDGQAVHHVLDSEGNLLRSSPLTTADYLTGGERELKVELANDGHLYIGAEDTILEFDENDIAVAAHSLDYGRLEQMARDPARGIYALSNSYVAEEGNRLFHLNAGETIAVTTLSVDGTPLLINGRPAFEVLTVTADGLLFAGNPDHRPALLRTDFEGEVVSYDVRYDFNGNVDFIAVRETTLGQVLVAGDAIGAAFVFEWPAPTTP